MSNNQFFRSVTLAQRRDACLIDFSRDLRILPGMAVVLCTGVEQGLLTTRKMMLERVGLMVVVATTQPAIIKACQRNTFHVAVVGQEENPEKKKRVFALIRRHCPSTKILEVYPIEVGRTLEEADDWLALPKQGPTELIERVATLVRPQPFGTDPKVMAEPRRVTDKAGA